jgi:signal transduction histidine kinase
VIFELKSPEDAGFDLLSKLTSYVEDYKKTTDIAVKLDMLAIINNIPPLKAKEIFYIIAEALTNVKRHSHARNVQITLKSNGNNNLIVDIVDDGKGFEASDAKLFSASSGGWGIIGMRQRAASLGGELVIDSSPERGARVSANIPLTLNPLPFGEREG